MTELYLIRHAQQIGASENDLLVLADHDDGLTETGHTQAKHLAQHLATKIKPAVLYTSPLARAYQTAEHISRATDLPINVEPALVELRLNCPPAAAPDIEFDGWLRARRDPRTPAFPGGESLAELMQRGLEAMEHITRQHGGQKIAIVTHGGLIEMLFLRLHHIPIECNLQSLIHVTHTGIFCWRWLEIAALSLSSWDLMYANDTHHLNGL